MGKGQSPFLRKTKFKNTHISTEFRTFYPYEQCRTYVNKRSSPDSDVFGNHPQASVFPIGTNFVQVSIELRCVKVLSDWRHVVGHVSLL